MRGVGGLVLLGVLSVGCGGAQRPDPTKEWLGRQAPAFDLEALDGSSVSLASLRGKVVVLHFGAHW